MMAEIHSIQKKPVGEGLPMNAPPRHAFINDNDLYLLLRLLRGQRQNTLQHAKPSRTQSDNGDTHGFHGM
jgi:hypothetical protein